MRGRCPIAGPERGSGVRGGLPAYPILVTPLNAESVCGDHWRHIRDWAREHGVPIFQLRNRPCIRATELLAAIEQYGAPQLDEPEAPTGATELEKTRRQFRRRKRKS